MANDSNIAKKPSFVKSKLFAIIVSVVATAIVMTLIGVLVFGIELFPTKAVDKPTALNINKVDFDPTGKSGYNITFVFNQNAVGEDKIGKDTKTQYFSFSPAIHDGGVFMWESPYRLVFKPNNPLTPSTKYIATMNRSEFSFWKGELTQNTKVEIETMRFAVSSISGNTIKDLEDTNNVQYKYNIFFNVPVNVEDVKKYTKISLDNKEIKYDVVDLPEDTKAVLNISLQTEKLLKLDDPQYLDITISKDLKGLGCELGLIDDYKESTKIDAKEYLNIYDIAVFSRENDKPYIKLSLNQQVDADKIKAYLNISPAIGDIRLSGGDYYLDIDGNLKLYEEYTITLSKGYEAIYGAIVKEDIVRTVYIDDIKSDINLEYPSMDFTAKGVYLPKEKSQKISVNTINVKKVDIEIYKIYSNNVVYYMQNNNYGGGYYDDEYYYDYYYYDDSTYRLGAAIHEETLSVKESPNMRTYTDVDLSKFLSETKGIFKIVVRDNEERWRSSSKWIVATDLGIVSKTSGKDMLVWINSLKTLKPKQNVKVKLLSYTNQLMSEGQTDSNGIVKFKNLDQLPDEFDPFIIIAETKDDFSFLKISEGQLSTVDFDVSGSYMPEKGIEAYLYMDRDIFRPGDKANLVSIVRSTNQVKINPMPVKLKVYNPKNQVMHELKGNLDNKSLTAEFNFEIPSYALTGYYRAELIMGENEVIGYYSFQVEEFMPATIKVEIKTNKESYEPGDEIEAVVNGMSLYGPPAANKKVQAKFTLAQSYFSPEKYKSYSFGDLNKSFSSYTNALGEFKLDNNGNYTYKVRLQDNIQPPSILAGTFSASVFDTGGRAVTRTKSFNIYPYDYYIGVKRNSDYYVQTDSPVPFEYVVVDKNGKEYKTDSLLVKIEKTYWVNILRRGDDGKMRYVSEERKDVVDTKTLIGQELTKPFIFTPTESGMYTMTFTTPADTRSSTSIYFYAYGWGGDSFSMAEPGKLLIELDKESYQVGDMANVIIKAPFSGKLLLTVERDIVLFDTVVELQKNTANIPIKITEEYEPNVYITGVIIRSIDNVEPFTPVRAFGIAPVKVENPNKKLQLTVKTPEKMEPNKPITIEVNVKGASLDGTRVTIAAVDEGILQLTDYKNPDPFEFFYRKRGLQVGTSDLYNFIIPDEEKLKTLYSNPGDSDRSETDYLSKSNAKRVKPVSLWSGILKVDEKNKASVTLEVPEFNGTLRVMAVAFDGNKYGSASGNTIVRAPIVLNPSFPRFLTIRDSYVFPVGVYNDTGSDGEISVTLSDNGLTNIKNATQKIFVRKEKEELLYFDVDSKDKIGDVYFTLTGKGNGKTAEKKIEMPQRSFRTLVSDVKSGAIKSNETVKINVGKDWIADATEYSLVVSSLPTVKFANSLRYLLQYPYGCAEQTTSTVMPLLYFKDLASIVEPGLMEEAMKNKYVERDWAAFFVERGIRKLESMQLSDGSIAYWPNGTYTNEWASIYACHFLVEAKKAGYQVSERVIDKLLGWLKTIVNRVYTVSGDDYYYYSELDKKAYAHYILALAGKPELAGMFYIKNNLLGRLSYDSRYFLVGALALSGYLDVGKELLLAKYKVEEKERETGANFYSTTRTIAIMLSVLADVDNTNTLIPELIKDLEGRAYNGYWYSTQETSFALLALGKVFKSRADDNYTISITDSKIGLMGTYKSGEKAVNIKLSPTSDISIKMEGTGEAYYTLNIFGIPDKDVEEYDKGLRVRRTFLDVNGKEVKLSDIKVGQLLVAKITLKANKYLDNVVILDLLPPGLEIENPRLSTSEDLAWASSSYVAQYMDIRDDRLLLFSYASDYENVFYYTVRAVTEGSFEIPSIMAEAMYNPDYSSLSSGGKLTINKD